MFETLKRLYNEGRIDSAKLEVAVIKGFITTEQKEQIIGQ